VSEVSKENSNIKVQYKCYISVVKTDATMILARQKILITEKDF